MTFEIPIEGRFLKGAEQYAALVWDYFLSPASDLFPFSREIKTIRAFAEITPSGVSVSHPSLRPEDEKPLAAFIYGMTS